MQNTPKSFENLPISLTVQQTAEILGISIITAYNLVKTKGFPALKIGKRIIIPKNSLMKWMEENAGQQAKCQ